MFDEYNKSMPTTSRINKCEIDTFENDPAPSNAIFHQAFRRHLAEIKENWGKLTVDVETTAVSKVTFNWFNVNSHYR